MIFCVCLSSRNHRFGKFYDSLCCLCATKRGFDLTVAGHGGACRVCLAKNVTDLHSQPHLHLDALCAKLSRMVYNMSNAVRSQLSGHFEILAENGLGDCAREAQTAGPGFVVLRALFNVPLILVVFRGSTSLIDWMVNTGATVVGVGPEGCKFNVHNGMHGRLGEASAGGSAFADDILQAIQAGAEKLSTDADARARIAGVLGGAGAGVVGAVVRRRGGGGGGGGATV